MRDHVWIVIRVRGSGAEWYIKKPSVVGVYETRHEALAKTYRVEHRVERLHCDACGTEMRCFGVEHPLVRPNVVPSKRISIDDYVYNHVCSDCDIVTTTSQRYPKETRVEVEIAPQGG
jgi:hypothetical protein